MVKSAITEHSLVSKPAECPRCEFATAQETGAKLAPNRLHSEKLADQLWLREARVAEHMANSLLLLAGERTSSHTQIAFG
jgi:hypothetical protein